MDILIKFTTYRARQAVFSHRAELKHAKIFERVFINEELTQQVVKCITTQDVW